MKKIVLSFTLALGLAGSVYAQAPAKFNYQGIARSAAGQPLASQALGMRLSVLDGSATGTAVYVETQTVTTNAYGLYVVQIGGGTVVSGTINGVNWATGSKFLKVEIDPAGGTAYTTLGNSQLLSVPYAMYSNTAGAPTLTLTGNVLTAGGNTVTLPSGGASYTAGTGITISGANAISANNTSPIWNANQLQSTAVSATGPTNGQALVYNGTAWTPATLAAGTTYTGGTGITVTGSTISANNLAGDVTGAPNANTVTRIQGTSVSATAPTSGQVLKYNGTAWAPAADNDAQTLSISGSTLSLTNGGSVTLPTGGGGTLAGTTNYITKFTSTSAVGNSQVYDDGTSVGIGTTTLSTGNKLLVVSTAGNAVTGNASAANFAGVYGTTSAAGFGVAGAVAGTGTGTAAYFDGGTAGKGILVPNGAVGFGIAAPVNRLSVNGGIATTGIDTNAAIYGKSNTANGSLKGGVQGTYDAVNYYGTGVTGIGYNGVTLQDAALAANYGLTNADAGVYGSGSFGVLGTSPTSGGVIGYTRAATTGGTVGVGNTLGVFGNAAAVGNTTAPTVRYGVYGQAVGGTTSNYGVFGTALASTAAAPSIGVRGDASTAGAGINYGLYGSAAAGATNYAGYFAGNVQVTGSISKGSGTFKIDHPQDPEHKYLYHSFVESPDMMNIYNGNITTDAQGFATVTMPGYFEALNIDFRYQLTAIGTFAQAIVKEEMSGNTFVIQTSQPNVKVSWQVTGVRNDKYAQAHRVQPEVPKEAANQGKYLHPAEWNQPASKGIDYDMLNQHTEVTSEAPARSVKH